jgi:hypothetical protein
LVAITPKCDPQDEDFALLGVARFRRKCMGIAFDADWTGGKSYVITDFVLIKLHFACDTMFDEDK